MALALLVKNDHQVYTSAKGAITLERLYHGVENFELSSQSINTFMPHNCAI